MSSVPAVVLAPPPLQARLADWKGMLAGERARLKARYLARKSCAELLRRNTMLVDRQLRSLWKALDMPASIALLAVGGYGRGQLFPHSDVDLLVLLPAPADASLAHKLEELLGLVWDVGLEVGHSVRTIAECAEIAAQDVTVQTSLLEARLVRGHRALFEKFVNRMRRELDVRSFFQAKQLEQQQRHARFQESSLEPNIKESPGGLRDLQNVLWIAGAAGLGASWRELSRRGMITREEMQQIQRHESFLQNVRIRLHYLAGRREDRLLFDHQGALARELGIADRPHRLASEQLMQRYYRTANAVTQLDTIVLQNLNTRIYPARRAPVQEINERFHVHDELLEACDERLLEREPHAIFESFRLLQQHHELKGMAAATLRALWRAKDLIGPAFRRDPVNRERFMQILRDPSRVVHELRRMNQYGILGRYLPAFGRIVGQLQYDLYHAYTVDEHILKVIRNLRRFSVPELAHEFPLCTRLMSGFERPEVLYLAAMFHDIAKGRGGDHSHLGAADARRFCRAHGLSAEDADLVAWLVEHHLDMSITAQKQDLSDPEVIRAFTERVDNERRLVALYLLTVADIRGTSPKVWNAWKGKLLEDMFWLTRLSLRGDALTAESDLQRRQDETKAKLRLYALPEGAHEKLWTQLDTTYFLRHEPQEIAWHTRLLYYRVESPVPVVKARLSPVGEGLQVMIYVRDQPQLFARICSFFEAMSYDIFEAKIYTTRHGYALDSFQVHDPKSRHVQYRDLISYIEYELAARLVKQTPLPPLARGRVSRQLRHFPISPEVNIQPDDRGTYHVLSVIAGDRLGLLSCIARTLAAYEISLHTAKINTLGERAEDIFLVTGEALKDPKTVVRLETELVEQLQG
ncbi:MAG: [protein-PII] uridylyltransferase [Betaproteobacteria bacterium]|nr:[protein-PII] uridylyltransferase [Betaproteobacteria bacterium]